MNIYYAFTLIVTLVAASASHSIGFAQAQTSAASQAATTPAEPLGDQTCPSGMLYVDTTYCTKVKDKCMRRGLHDRSNHPSICAEYDRNRTCVGETRRQRFCIDKYEFPNEKGGHSPIMINAWDAAGLCHEQGKRLCWESEWTAACEGSQKTPFPYGYVRDPTKCNMDQTWVQPIGSNMVSRNQNVQDRELSKLDKSVRSGSMEGCTNDFGVFDMTGNFSEWTFIEKARGRNKWAGTKGGWWGPLRNSCRPTGVGHPELFIFYSLSTRCCKDPNPQATGPMPKDGIPLWTPPKPPKTGPDTPIWPPNAPKPALNRGWVPPDVRAKQK